MIETASGELARAKNEGTSAFQLCGGTGPARVDGLTDVLTIAHNLVSLAGLCDDGHTFPLTERSCVIRMEKKHVVVGRSTDWM